jgi:hypothetical protein
VVGVAALETLKTLRRTAHDALAASGKAQVVVAADDPTELNTTKCVVWCRARPVPSLTLAGASVGPPFPR